MVELKTFLNSYYVYLLICFCAHMYVYANPPMFAHVNICVLGYKHDIIGMHRP